jgi:hypothetical protein
MKGGARKGAGRKPGPHGTKQTITLRLTEDVCKFLETMQGERSDKIDSMVRKSAAFKAWKTG